MYASNCITTYKDETDDDFDDYQIADNSDGDEDALQHQAPSNDCICGYDVLEMLENRQVDVNAKNDYGQTVLHLVAGQIETENSRAPANHTPEKLVKLLIEQGALPNAQDNCGNTALHLAVARVSPFLLNHLASKVFNFKQKNQPIHPVPQYTHYGFDRFVNMLETLSKICDVNVTNSSGKSPLHIAAERGSLKAVTTLLAAGAKVNIQDVEGNTPLHCIFISKQNYFRCSTSIMRALLGKGADVNVQNVRGETPLHLFIDWCIEDSQCKWEDDLRSLLSRGVDSSLQDEKGETCLIRAVWKKLHPIGVESLLRHRALLNLKDNKGNSALHHAAMSLSQETMTTLVEAGADCNSQNNDGKTPLHLFFEHLNSFNNIDLKVLVKLSMRHGFNVNLQDRKGDSLLHLATRSYWCDELLNVLLVKGARIDMENCEGETVASLYVDNLYKTCSDVDLIKLTEAGIKYYMTNGIDTVVHNTLRSEFFARSCSKELARMKETKIGSIFSKYKDPVYIADDELEELVAFGDLMDQFPIYGILLQITYERAKKRNRLLDVLSCSFHSANSTLPSEVSRLILHQLSDKDLLNLFKASGLQEKKES